MNYRHLQTPAALWLCRDAPPEHQLALQESVNLVTFSELIATICGLPLAKAETLMKILCGQSNLLDPHILWARLRVASLYELQTLGELTPKQAAKLKAALELGRRVYVVDPELPEQVNSPEDMYQLLSQHLAFQAVECFAAIALDVKHRVLAVRQFSQGTATETTIPPRELFRWALTIGATRLAIAHNHPSGDTTPSAQDQTLTAHLVTTAHHLGLYLLDHIIIGNGTFSSIRQQCPHYWEVEQLPF